MLSSAMHTKTHIKIAFADLSRPVLSFAFLLFFVFLFLLLVLIAMITTTRITLGGLAILTALDRESAMVK